MLTGNYAFVKLPAIGTCTLVQNKMLNIKVYFRQFKLLVCVKLFCVLEIGTSATALFRLAALSIGGLENFFDDTPCVRVVRLASFSNRYPGLSCLLCFCMDYR